MRRREKSLKPLSEAKCLAEEQQQNCRVSLGKARWKDNLPHSGVVKNPVSEQL